MRYRPFHAIAKLASLSLTWKGSGSPSRTSRAASQSEGSSSHASPDSVEIEDQQADDYDAPVVLGGPILNVANLVGEAKALAIHCYPPCGGRFRA